MSFYVPSTPVWGIKENAGSLNLQVNIFFLAESRILLI